MWHAWKSEKLIYFGRELSRIIMKCLSEKCGVGWTQRSVHYHNFSNSNVNPRVVTKAGNSMITWVTYHHLRKIPCHRGVYILKGQRFSCQKFEKAVVFGKKMWNKNKDWLHGKFDCVQYFIKVYFTSESLKSYICRLEVNAGAVSKSTLWYGLNFRNHLYSVITHTRDQHYHLSAVKEWNSLEFIAVSWNVQNDMYSYGETSLRWTGYEISHTSCFLCIKLYCGMPPKKPEYLSQRGRPLLDNG
jgi:hypothetical protein